jgi:hypothetical protein
MAKPTARIRRMMWNKSVLLIAVLAAAACSPDDQKPNDQKNVRPRGHAAATTQSRPIGHRPEPMKTAVASDPLLFHGYACGTDCIGHQEGYSWASAHNISDPADCHGTSETFIEGCKAFAGLEGPLGGRYIDQSFPHMIGSD